MKTSRVSETLRIRVSVTPGAKREYVTEKGDNAFSIVVKEKATDGRANERVKELIARRFSVPVKNVQFIKGSRTRNKMVLIYL